MFAEGAQLLDDAIAETVTAPPLEALAFAKEALRANRRVRCLRVHSACLVANNLALLKRVGRATRIFRAARSVAAGCPCCLPVVDRYVAVLLSNQSRHTEALMHADRAVRADPRNPACRIYRAFVRHAAEAPGAVEDLSDALWRLAPTSPFHSLALYNLAVALYPGTNEADLVRIFELLPEIRVSFRNLPDLSRQRAHLAWLDGATRAALAEFRPAQAKILRQQARESLRAAVRRFKGLKLDDEQAAAWADLAAVLLRSPRARYASPAGGEFWSECLKRRPPNRPDRWIPLPSGQFQAPAREILRGNPSRLRRFRDSTRQSPPIVPYPEVRGQSLTG